MTMQTDGILKKLALVVASGLSDLGAVLPREVSGVFNATAIAAAIGTTGTTQATPNESSEQTDTDDPDLDQKIEAAKNKIAIWSETGTKSAMLNAFKAINEIDATAPIKDKMLAVAALNEHLPGYAVSYLKESLILKADGAKPEDGSTAQLGGELLNKLRQRDEPILRDQRVAHLFRALLSGSNEGNGSNYNGAGHNRPDPFDRDIAIELLKALPVAAFKDFAVYHERAREALKAIDPSIDTIDFKDIPSLYIGLREVDGRNINIPLNQLKALWGQFESVSNNGIVSDARVVLAVEAAFFESLTKRLDTAGVWYQDSLVDLFQGAPSNVQNSAQALLSCISSKDLQSTLKEKVLAQDSTFYTLLDNVAEKLPKESAASNIVEGSYPPYERYSRLIGPYAKGVEYEDVLQPPFEDGRFTPSDITHPRFYASRGEHISSIHQTLRHLNDETSNRGDKIALRALIDSVPESERADLSAAIQSFRTGEITKRELELGLLVIYLRNPGNEVGDLVAPVVEHSLQDLGIAELLPLVAGEEKLTREEVLEKARGAFIKLLEIGSSESDPQALDLLHLLLRHLPDTQVYLQRGFDSLMEFLKSDVHKRYPLVKSLTDDPKSLFLFTGALGDGSIQTIAEAPIPASAKFNLVLEYIAVVGAQPQQDGLELLNPQLVKEWAMSPDKNADRVLDLCRMASSGDVRAAAGAKMFTLLGELYGRSDRIDLGKMGVLPSMIVDVLKDTDIPIEIREEAAKMIGTVCRRIGYERPDWSELVQESRATVKSALEQLIPDYGRQSSKIVFDLIAALEIFPSVGLLTKQNRLLDLVTSSEVLDEHKPILVRLIDRAAQDTQKAISLGVRALEIQAETAEQEMATIQQRLRSELERVPPHNDATRGELLIAIGSYGYFTPVETARYLLQQLNVHQERGSLQLAAMKGIASLLLATGKHSPFHIVAGAEVELRKLGDDLMRLTAKFIEDGKSDLAEAALGCFNVSSVLYEQEQEKIFKFLVAVMQSPKAERSVRLEAVHQIDAISDKICSKMEPIHLRSGPNVELQRQAMPIVEVLQAEIQRSRGNDTETLVQTTKTLSRLSKLFEEGEAGANLFAFLIDTNLPRAIADASDMTEEAKLNCFREIDVWEFPCLGWSFLPQLLDIAADSKYPFALRRAAIISTQWYIDRFKFIALDIDHSKDLALVQGVSAARDKFADLAIDKSLLDLRKEINLDNLGLLDELYGFWALDNFFRFSMLSDKFTNSSKLDEERSERLKSVFRTALDGSYFDGAPKGPNRPEYEDFFLDPLEKAWSIPEYQVVILEMLQEGAIPEGVRSSIERLQRGK